MKLSPARFRRCLLDAVWPEACTLCGGEADFADRSSAGGRSWDRPHLCRRCWNRLAGRPIHSMIVGPESAGITVTGGGATGPELVQLVGAMKYHGVRGLADPLGALLAAGLAPHIAELAPEALVPVPLHRRRRAERGFNQAALLAAAAACRLDLPVLDGVVARRRGTGQQAKLANSGTARGDNVRGAFRAPGDGRGGRIVLVDDIVTSGATIGAVAAVLTEAGWNVVAAAAVGVAATA